MSNLKYTIISFDAFKKVLVVDFGLDGWANINLISPLPANQEELEAIIRRYAPAEEQIAAVTEPTDLSYITQMIGHSYSTSRFKLTGDTVVYEPPTPEELEALSKAEEIAFEEKVLEILKRTGLIHEVPCGD